MCLGQGTFDDFNQMVIQYGYLALFAPACPLAPVLAFVNNCTEIRGDAFKLCLGFQRPWAQASSGIGSWFDMLRVLGTVSVITNATMIAFVGSQLATDHEQVIYLQVRELQPLSAVLRISCSASLWLQHLAATLRL